MGRSSSGRSARNERDFVPVLMILGSQFTSADSRVCLRWLEEQLVLSLPNYPTFGVSLSNPVPELSVYAA